VFTPELRSLINLHRRELTKQAEHYQLIRQAAAVRPGLESRILIGLGGLLIALGQSIQERYQRALSENAGVVQPLSGQQDAA
jgi:hypothetical protein